MPAYHRVTHVVRIGDVESPEAERPADAETAAHDGSNDDGAGDDPVPLQVVVNEVVVVRELVPGRSNRRRVLSPGRVGPDIIHLQNLDALEHSLLVDVPSRMNASIRQRRVPYGAKLIPERVGGLDFSRDGEVGANAVVDGRQRRARTGL